MPMLPPEMEEIYAKALDELFALGRNLPRGSFRLMAEKYDIKEDTLRTKYWKRTGEKPSPFLQDKGITIGDIRFESNPFQIAEAIKLLIRRLNTAEDKNRSLQADLDRLSVKYAALEEKHKKLLDEREVSI
jgi:hypothetical protein